MSEASTISVAGQEKKPKKKRRSWFGRTKKGPEDEDDKDDIEKDGGKETIADEAAASSSEKKGGAAEEKKEDDDNEEKTDEDEDEDLTLGDQQVGEDMLARIASLNYAMADKNKQIKRMRVSLSDQGDILAKDRELIEHLETQLNTAEGLNTKMVVELINKLSDRTVQSAQNLAEARQLRQKMTKLEHDVHVAEEEFDWLAQDGYCFCCFWQCRRRNSHKIHRAERDN